mgnify:CR=1 FL=1
MASSQTTEQLLAQLANFTAMGQLANLTPEQLAKFTPEQLNILMGVHPTGASTAVPVQLVAPPVAGGSDSSGNMKVSQDTVSVGDTGKKTESQKLKSEAARAKRTVEEWKRKLMVSEGNLKQFPKDKSYQNKVNTAAQKVIEWNDKVEKLEAAVEAAEKKATPSSLPQKEKAKRKSDEVDSLSGEDSEEDSEEDFEDGNRGMKRKADERDEEEDEEGHILPATYEFTTHPETGESTFITSIHGMQQIIGGMQDAEEPIYRGWELKTKFLSGFLSALSPDEGEWTTDKRIKATEHEKETTDLFREIAAIRALDKLLPNCKVTFTGEDARTVKKAHDLVHDGIAASKDAKEAADAPENDVVYSCKRPKNGKASGSEKGIKRPLEEGGAGPSKKPSLEA